MHIPIFINCSAYKTFLSLPICKDFGKWIFYFTLLCLCYFSALSMGKPSGHSDVLVFRTKKTESIVICSTKKKKREREITMLKRISILVYSLVRTEQKLREMVLET